MPMVMEGSIVVDGILASCYTCYDHDMAHFIMTPIGWFPYIMEWIFGNEDGTPSYINMGRELGTWLLPYDYLYSKVNF